MTKRVLITGIGGSIGCHVMRHVFVNTDWEVIGLDSFRHKGLTDRVERMLVKHPETRCRLRVFTHDLVAPISQMLEQKIGHVDYIINLAAMSDVAESIADPVYTCRSNNELMLTMLEYTRKVEPEVFLHVSTDEVYGPVSGRTFHREWDTILPSSPYSAAKAAQEGYAIAYWRSYRVPLIIVNLMNNFGEMQSPLKFPAIAIRKILRGETVTIHGSPPAIGSRFYIHSRNSADAMLFLIQNHMPYLHTEGRVDRPDRYNVVGGRCLTNLELAQLFADYLEKPLHFKYEPFPSTRPGHDWHYGEDGTKLANLGWTAPVSLEESLRETALWYKRNPEWLEPR